MPPCANSKKPINDDVAFIRVALGPLSLKVLEPCCGGGRILVPLARAGHDATGFDTDAAMREYIVPRVTGLDNFSWSRRDAVLNDWGTGYDAVVLAVNILINIASDMDCKQAQRLFIIKVSDCLVTGGLMVLDFARYAHPERIFDADDGEWTIFKGKDDRGTRGCASLYASRYDLCTRISTFRRRSQILPAGSASFILERPARKHIFTLAQVMGWLHEAGFTVEGALGDYEGHLLGEGTQRAAILAGKTQYVYSKEEGPRAFPLV